MREACGHDTALQAEVEALLATEGRADLLADREIERRSRRPASRGPGPRGPSEGDRIGPYRLGTLIETGGMGEVWRASREGEFEREVAIKLIRRGIHSDDVVERFRRERQVLAALIHPHIAHLLDGGATESGQPYLVLEYVDGVPIDAFVRDRGLDVAGRLTLFLKVCAAVEHAHRGLVIHRDLKPSNILVTDDGEPKLLDFGIAKVLEPTGPHLDVTATQERRFTPRYASPEQARGEHLTTATDVYSLGVILYELLVDAPPYDLANRPPTEYARIISEVEPQKPSHALSDGHTSGVETRRLRRQLSGDLDTIVLTALRKEPSRRYESVERLGGDIQRHLRGLPITARPDTLKYRAGKFVRRNRGLTIAMGVVAVLLLAWLGTSTYLFIRAESARRGELARAREAQRERAEAEWQAYDAGVAAAESAIRADRVAEARRRLDRTPPGLRGWEWWHLDARTDRSAHVLRARGPLAFVANDRLMARSVTGDLMTFDTQGWEATPLGDEQVRTFAVDPEGTRFAFVTSGRRSRLCAGSAADPDGVATVDLGTRVVEHLTWGARDRLIGATTAGELVRWAGIRGEEPTFTSVTDGRIRALAVSPDGASIAVAISESEAGRVMLLAADDLAPLREFARSPRRFETLAFSGVGRRFAAGSLDGTVRIWDPAGPDDAPLVLEHGANVWCMAFAPDGSWLVTGDGGGVVRRWDAGTGALEATLRGHAEVITGLAISRDGATIASSDAGGEVRIWAAGTQDVPMATLCARVDDFAISADGSIMASRYGEVWSTKTLAEIVRVPAHGRGVALSADGARIAYLAAGRVVGVADTASGEVLATMTGMVQPVRQLALDAPGALLAVATADGTIHVYEVESGASLWSSRVHAGRVFELEFAPDSRMLASGGRDDTIRLWAARTGEELGVLHAYEGSVYDVDFSPDGRTLVSAHWAGVAAVWDVGSRRLVRTLRGHDAAVYCVAVSADGSRVATGSEDRTVQVHDLASGRTTAVLHGHEATVRALAFAPDMSWLLSVDTDGTARRWQAPPTAERLVRRLRNELVLTADIVARLERLSLDEDVKAQAIALASTETDDAHALGEQARGHVRHPGDSDYVYQLGLRQARAACRLAPNDPDLLTVRALAEFRTGRLDDVVATLDAVESLRPAAPTPTEIAVRALSLHAAGQDATSAREALLAMASEEELPTGLSQRSEVDEAQRVRLEGDLAQSWLGEVETTLERAP